MNHFEFGAFIAEMLAEKAATDIHPLQSPMAGYREQVFQQRQVQQQQEMAAQQQQAQQQAANLPQGPTTTSTPNIAPAQPLEAHDIQNSALAGPAKAAGLQDIYNRVAHTAGDLATTYSMDGMVPTVARGVSLVHSKAKELANTLLHAKPARMLQPVAKRAFVVGAVGALARGLGQGAQAVGRGAAAAGRTINAVGQGVVTAGRVGATVGRGAWDFGRGATSLARPAIGLLRNGLPGARAGVQAMGRTMLTNGRINPMAVAGAAAGAYGLYNTLQSPIQHTGDGIRVRSPIRIPAVRARSPVVYGGGLGGGGVRLRNPIKVLW